MVVFEIGKRIDQNRNFVVNMCRLFKVWFNGDLIYKFKKIMGRADFSDQSRKIIIRHTRIGYDLNVMRQSAC